MLICHSSFPDPDHNTRHRQRGDYQAHRAHEDLHRQTEDIRAVQPREPEGDRVPGIVHGRCIHLLELAGVGVEADVGRVGGHMAPVGGAVDPVEISTVAALEVKSFFIFNREVMLSGQRLHEALRLDMRFAPTEPWDVQWLRKRRRLFVEARHGGHIEEPLHGGEVNFAAEIEGHAG